MEELLLADSVRSRAEKAFPVIPIVADNAASAALQAFASGASMGEAWRIGRRYADCFQRHPSIEATTRPGRSVHLRVVA